MIKGTRDWLSTVRPLKSKRVNIILSDPEKKEIFLSKIYKLRKDGKLEKIQVNFDDKKIIIRSAKHINKTQDLQPA